MKTHRILFKGNLDPVYIERESADLLKEKIDKGDRGMIEINEDTIRISDIKAIIRLKEGIKPSSNFKRCMNRMCNKQNRMHAWHEVCEFSETSECSSCQKKLLEKDRKHSIMIWNKQFCYSCSPLGKTIGNKPKENAERFVNAFIESAMKDTKYRKGMTEEQALKKANEMLKMISNEFPEMKAQVKTTVPKQLALPDKKTVQDKVEVRERRVKSLPF